MNLPGYDNWLLRGSGAYSTEREIALDEPCDECGTTAATLHVNDFGQPYVECENGHEQPEPEDNRDYDDEPYWDERD